MPEGYASGFPQRLLALRPAKLSLGAYLKRLGLTFSHVTRWKTGTSPSIKTVEHIRGLLWEEFRVNTSRGWLGFGETQTPN